ncbi:hypothetical protein A7D17_03995 [Xanthomonas floridensis]|nr:hypothetical protein A7D17_03995 [Xanthomonas floridensis]
MTPKQTALYFKHVIAISAERALLSGLLYCQDSEPNVSRAMMIAEGRWYHLYDLEDITQDCVRQSTRGICEREVYCLLGRQGMLRTHPSGQAFCDEQLPLANSYLKALRDIDGQLYACGTQGQVLRRTPGGWVRMDQGVYESMVDQVTSSLNALDGAAANDIYAAGDGGALWHWDGVEWTRLDSPTRLPLYVVHRHSDGLIYLAGSGGVLFRGSRHHGWADLSGSAFGHLVMARACEFQGTLYLACGSDLLCFANDVLSVVDVPLPGALTFHGLGACAEALWCVGNEGVLSFDGSQWRAHPCPEN